VHSLESFISLWTMPTSPPNNDSCLQICRNSLCNVRWPPSGEKCFQICSFFLENCEDTPKAPSNGEICMKICRYVHQKVNVCNMWNLDSKYVNSTTKHASNYVNILQHAKEKTNTWTFITTTQMICTMFQSSYMLVQCLWKCKLELHFQVPTSSWNSSIIYCQSQICWMEKKKNNSKVPSILRHLDWHPILLILEVALREDRVENLREDLAMLGWSIFDWKSIITLSSQIQKQIYTL